MTLPDRLVSATVARVLSHDRDALEELLLLRYDWLRDVAHRALPPSVRAVVCVEEVLQEAFVHVLRGYDGFTAQDGEASLYLWLKTIVQNAARDALRQRARRRESAMTDCAADDIHDRRLDCLASLAVSKDPRASVVAQGHEMTQAFYVALANLDPKYQRVLELLYLEQLTVEQTAQRLEISPAAVRGLRQRARDKMREAMVRLSHCL